MLRVFFFQAEDGIRDRNVTGVQTCALPIFNLGESGDNSKAKPVRRGGAARWRRREKSAEQLALEGAAGEVAADARGGAGVEIGRASCRERGASTVGADAVYDKRGAASRARS